MSSQRHQLPPLPKTIRTLTNDESRALNFRFPDSQKTVEDCQTCLGRKTFRWWSPDRTEIVEYDCNCVDQYLLHRWLSHRGILKSYQRLGWGDLFNGLSEDVVAAIGDYVEHRQGYVNAGVGIIFTGTKGNGKTMLANLLLKQMIAEGENVYATTFSDMIDLFAGGWQDREQSRWFERTVRNAGVLFIDDLGRERNKGPASVGENMLETIARARVGNSQPMIITTNMPEEEIHKGYGDHVLSLLSERSVIIKVTGDDRRVQTHQRLLDEVRQGLCRPVTLT